MSLETPGATRGVERRVISRFGKFGLGRAWVVEEPYHVASDIYFIGSEACRHANGVTVGVFDVGKVCIPVIWAIVATHA